MTVVRGTCTCGLRFRATRADDVDAFADNLMQALGLMLTYARQCAGAGAAANGGSI